ncbi:hypothetical protein T439DRAFT_329671 [Meredithblackwellia eburnea MCA 4105]
MDSIEVEDSLRGLSDPVSTSSVIMNGTLSFPADPSVKRPPRIGIACTRCKQRKQRCHPDSSSAKGKCRNCASVGAECVFTARPEKKSKRQRTSNSTSGPTTSTSVSPPPHSQQRSNGSQPPLWSVLSLNHDTPSLNTQSGPSSRPTPMTTPSLASLPSITAEPPATQRSTGTRSDTFSPASQGDGEAGESDDEEGRLPWTDAARGVAFLSLNASGSTVYVGPSSGFSWARVILGGMAGAEAAQGQASASRHFPPDVNSMSYRPSPTASRSPIPDNALESVAHEVAESVLSHTFRHVQPRYPFLDWLLVHEYWQHRDEIMMNAVQPGATSEVRTAAFFIWMIFAIGARLVKSAPAGGLATPEQYYDKAMNHLEIIVVRHDLKNVQALMLMVMYYFRSSDSPSVWFVCGIIIRLCVSLGLHRKLRGPRAATISPYVLQLRKRLFWTAYYLDRMMSMSLGRPMGISDRDIDIDLPLDLDCVDPNPLAENVKPGITSMSSGIHLTKLKQIESLIQKQAYRVDRPVDDSPDNLLCLLDAWQAEIPEEASGPNVWNIPSVSHDYFVLRGLEARLYLLRPLSVGPSLNPKYIKLLAQYAAEACETHKRLHQSPTWWLSLEAMRTTFLDGLTLLHAARLDRHALSPSVLNRAIRANSNTLFMYIQHFPAGQRFHDAFEDLASRVLDHIAASPSSANVGVVDPVVIPPAGQDEYPWASLLTEMPSVMSEFYFSFLFYRRDYCSCAADQTIHKLDFLTIQTDIDFQDDYTTLLDSLGVTMDHMLSQDLNNGASTPFGGNGDYSSFPYTNFF